MIILQCVLTYVFMERHWQLVTNRLSTALTQDIAAIIDLHKTFPGSDDEVTRIAQDRLKIDADFLPLGPLPPALPKPFFQIVDAALSSEIRRQISRPFWLDTVGRSNLIEIRIQLDDSILRVIAYRSAAYASNSYIFLLWMVGTSFVLIVVADDFPAQSDQADPVARRRRGGIRQGPRPRLPAARRARGAPGRSTPSSR